MRYTLFMFKPNAAASVDDCVEIINRAYALQSIRLNNDIADFTVPFYAKRAKTVIENTLLDLCKVFACTSQKNRVISEYIYIVTSYSRAKEIRHFLFSFAAGNDLILYDAETKKTSEDLLFDDTFISLRIRERELQSGIKKEILRLWKVRKIHERIGADGMYSCYSVTLLKDPEVPFIERVNGFYGFLKKNALDCERVENEERCFSVYYGFYSIGFVLEGYKKHSDTVGFIEEGVAKKDLMRRMGVEEAVKWMDRNCSDREKKNIQERMDLTEMIDDYPNPSDRFVACLNAEKELKKRKKKRPLITTE